MAMKTFILSLLWSLIPILSYAHWHEVDGFRFDRLDRTTCILIRSLDYSRREAVIPSEVDGLTVVEIKEYAFLDHEDLETVVIPTSVTKIGNEVFFGCNNLKELNIPYSITDIGLKFFGAHHLAAIDVDADNPVYSSVANIEDRSRKNIVRGLRVADATCGSRIHYAHFSYMPTYSAETARL